MVDFLGVRVFDITCAHYCGDDDCPRCTQNLIVDCDRCKDYVSLKEAADKEYERRQHGGI